MLSSARGRGALNQILPISSLSRPPSPKATSSTPSRTVKRLSYTLRNRAAHNKMRVLLGSLLLAALFLWMRASTHSHPAARRLRARSLQRQTVFDSSGKSHSGGVSFLDTDDTDEWLAEDDLFFSQYTEDVPMSPEDQAAEAEMASRKADVVEQNRQQSLRALTWWLAEGGEIPENWEVPSKAYLKKVGGRGVERLLEDIEDVTLGDDPVFEEGWEDFAKKRYRIVVFSKASLDAHLPHQSLGLPTSVTRNPWLTSQSFCPYSRKAKQILSEYYLSPAPFIIELDSRSDMAEIQTLLEHLTGRRTVPNILLDFASIGGSDDLMLMHSEGALQRRFEEMDALPGYRRYQPIAPHIPPPPPPPAPAPQAPVAAAPAAGKVAGDDVPRAPGGAQLNPAAGLLDVVSPEKLGYAPPPDSGAMVDKIQPPKGAGAGPLKIDAEEDKGAADAEDEDEDELEDEGDEEDELEAPGKNNLDRGAQAAKLSRPKAPAPPAAGIKAGADPADIRAAVQAAHGDAYLYNDEDGDSRSLDEGDQAAVPAERLWESDATYGVDDDAFGFEDEYDDDDEYPEDDYESEFDDEEQGDVWGDGGVAANFEDAAGAGQAPRPAQHKAAVIPPVVAPKAPVKPAEAPAPPKPVVPEAVPKKPVAQAQAALKQETEPKGELEDGNIQREATKPQPVVEPVPAAAAKKADTVADVKVDAKPAAGGDANADPAKVPAAGAGNDARARAKAKVAAAKARKIAAAAAIGGGGGGAAKAQAQAQQPQGQKVDTLLERANAAAQAKRKAIQDARAKARDAAQARKAAKAGKPVEKKDAAVQQAAAADKVKPIDAKKAAAANLPPAQPIGNKKADAPVEKKADPIAQKKGADEQPAAPAPAPAHGEKKQAVLPNGKDAGKAKAEANGAQIKGNNKVAAAPDAKKPLPEGKKDVLEKAGIIIDNKKAAGAQAQAQAPVAAPIPKGEDVKAGKAGGAGAGAGAGAVADAKAKAVQAKKDAAAAAAKDAQAKGKAAPAVEGAGGKAPVGRPAAAAGGAGNGKLKGKARAKAGGGARAQGKAAQRGNGQARAAAPPGGGRRKGRVL